MKRRLYIFPALIPLAELLPWLLALIGGTAGFMHHLKRFASNKVLIGITAVCFLAAAGLLTWQWIESPSRAEGSVLVAKDNLPKTVTFKLEEPTLYTSKKDDFSLLWQAQNNNEYLSEPIIHNGVIYTGMMNGFLEARNAKTGQKLWTLQKREGIYAPLAVGKDKGFQAEGLHTTLYSALTAFTLADGKALWERRFRGHLEAAPVVDNNKDLLYFSAGTQGFWVLDANTGEEIWHKQLGHMDISPLLKDGVIYVASWTDPKSMNSVFYALNPKNGDILWEKEFNGHPMEQPLADDAGNIYFGTALGQIALDRADDAGWAHAVTKKGDLLWSRQLETMSIPNMSLLKESGLLFLSLKNGKLLALSTSDGKIVWEKKFDFPFIAPSLLITETKKPAIVAKTSDGRVTIMSAETGERINDFTINANGYSASAFADGLLYVADQYNLYATRGLDHLIDRAAKK